jgi:hypothetical protein
MKALRLSYALGSLFCVAAFGWASEAPAVTLRTVVAPIYQMGNGSQVNIGHTADASTNYNRLYAGGSYTVGCEGDVPEAVGSNYLSAENLLGGLKLIVTIPRWHPATVNLTAFYNVPRGQTIHCMYNWISKAEEGGYSVGVNGITFQTGNGKREEGSSQPFIMRNPGVPDVNDPGTCIP